MASVVDEDPSVAPEATPLVANTNTTEDGAITDESVAETVDDGKERQRSLTDLLGVQPVLVDAPTASIATMLGACDCSSCSSFARETVRLYRTVPPRSVEQT